MSIDNLISEVDKLKEEEKAELSELYEKEIKELNDKFERELEQEKNALAKNLSAEKERRLLLYKQNKRFELKMEELKNKKKLSEKLEAEIKKSVPDSTSGGRVEIFAKEAGKMRRLFEEADRVLVKPSFKSEAIKILEKAGIRNVEITESPNFDSFGFLIESEDFSVELSIEKIFGDFSGKEAARITNEIFSLK